MPPAEPRSLGQRIADTRALLIQPAVDAWVATASQARGDGQSQPYLVPLSFAWIEDGYVYVVLRPERIQAWRESNELPGRAIMREGELAKG